MSEKINRSFYYLKTLQENYGYFQPEMREAIDTAVEVLKDKINN